MITFLRAFEAALLADDRPVVTDLDLYRKAERLLSEGSWDQVKIKHAPKAWDVARLHRAIRRLVRDQVIASDNDFRSGVWRVVQATRAGVAEEVACIADPFCYVSHLSAMFRYGLTDRSPAALHLTTPERALWNQRRDDLVASLETPPQDPTSLLHRYGFKDKLRRRPVVIHETRHPAAPLPLSGEQTRIAAIGDTFADTLGEPALCGGMRHVLEVWDRHAEEWIDAIIEAVDRSKSKIVKVRAGHILSERLGIQDERIGAWLAFAQRGGSRKLDPEAPYAPVFSEPWMLSLNV